VKGRVKVMGRMFDRGEKRGFFEDSDRGSDGKRGSGSDGGSDRGSGRGLSSGSGSSSEHDSQCESLLFLRAFLERRLINTEEAIEVISILKTRFSPVDSRVRLQDRVCGCGTRGLLRGRGALVEYMEKWGENMGELIFEIVGKEETDRRRARILRMLQEIDEIIDDK
jgi:hypothetical protein